jgi:2-keto-4-pentenoate hydratase/2-oxohepta-3-ene-1,7-dioic acid hydratase in catechol pathway
MGVWVRFARDGAEGFGMLADGAVRVFAGDMFADAEPTGEVAAAADVRLLAPVRPGKFIGLWNNVRSVAIAQEHGIPDYPLFFLKAASSIIGPEEAFRAPEGYAGRVVYEGELGVVIGRTCRNVDEAGAEAAIFGYTCVNDVTAVGLFGDNPKFEQWARAKSCDGFGPVGPGIATGLDWRGLVIRTLLNGRERQNYPAGDFILSPPAIVSLLSREMSLLPGDLISCGTGAGILPMRPGMTVEVAIEGIGVLRNRFAG